MLLGLAAVTVSACAREASAPTPNAAGAASEAGTVRELAAIEASVGGRVGVFVLDTGSGRTLAQRADERFAMCSTFKWVLASAVLARVDRGEMSLDQRIPYGKADLIEETSPVTSERVAEGGLPVETLARAVLTVSDNAAANLLLAQVGGPPGLTAFIRQTGDTVTRLDRNEGALNSNDPGDPRDTTSPRAMVGLMRAILGGDVLKPASRDRRAIGAGAHLRGAVQYVVPVPGTLPGRHPRSGSVVTDQARRSLCEPGGLARVGRANGPGGQAIGDAARGRRNGTRA